MYRILAVMAVLAAALPAQPLLVAGPRALLDAAAKLRARRAHEGFDVELLPTPNAGEPEQVAAALRERVHAAIKNSQRPGYLLLLGDSERGGFPLPSLPRPGLPTYLKSMPGKKRVWSDLGYVDTDGDGVPEWSVGRIPVRGATALRHVVDKILAYQKAPPPSSLADDWVRTTAVIGSEGNFGPVIDAVLEKAVFKLYREQLDPLYRLWPIVTLERSPFRVAAEKFNDAVLDCLNAGPFAAVYMGHGSLDRFANVDVFYPVLRIGDVTKLKGASRSILMAYACHIGEFPRRCLGEELLRAPGGPVAVVAASEVSFPYGDMLLGREMMQVLGGAGGAGVRIGDLVRLGKQRLMADSNDRFRRDASTLAALTGLIGDVQTSMRRYTSDLYQLLGDPSMPLDLPRPIEVALAGDAVRGQPLKLALTVGEGPRPDEVRAELCVDRGLVAGNGRSDVLEEREVRWPAGRRELEVSFDGADGRYVSVRVLGRGAEGAWAGGLRFRLRRPQ